MRLLRLHIIGFGTLKHFRMDFCNGLNSFHHENGWGKSTLAVFIKAMLYGLPATTKRSLDENERKKYTPWQGGEYGGSLELECQKGQFRIERFFGAKESSDSFALFDLATNLPSNAFSSAIGEELLGIDADGFERTVYLSQRNTSSHGNNVTITAKLGNLLDDVDDIAGFDRAMALLDKRRKYYVMTGNRGRIAELEQEQTERQADLESLYRTRDALKELQKEQEEQADRMETVQAKIDCIRSELQSAALLQEKNTLLEQKQRMESEIASLRQKESEGNRFFRGMPPSDSELDEIRRLFRQYNDATARMDAHAKKVAFPCPLELLSEQDAEQIPSDQFLSKLIAENSELQTICRKETVLKTEKARIDSTRFPNGIPSIEVINAAFTSLDQAKKLRHEAQEVEDSQAKNIAPISAIPILLWIFIGALLFVCSVLPPFSAYLLPFMIAGGCCLTVGAALTWIAAKKRIKQKKEWEHIARQTNHLRQTAENEQAAAIAILNKYGKSTDGDPVRALTELALLSRQAVAERKKEAQIDAELKALQQNKSKVLSFLQSGFRLYGIMTLPVKDDYRDEIEALRRDITLLRHFQKEEQLRNRNYIEAEAEQTRLKQQLIPLLNRYGNVAERNIEECLNTLTARTVEYRRISEELLQKKADLQKFITEKQLDSSELPHPIADRQILVTQENALQTELLRLQEQQAELKARTERLAREKDQIPEAEEQLTHLKELIKDAKANSATVSATMRFLEEAKTALSTRYLDDMQTGFQQFLSMLIADTPPESVMNTEFEVSIRTDGKTHSTECLSRGWRDAIQFCTRLSLTAALYKDGEKPFLLLDDPFVNLDDERLAAAKKMITALSDTYQIIYMVCHADRL